MAVMVQELTPGWSGAGTTTVQPAALFLIRLLAALAPSLAANVYIVGLNQLTDIDIDRINKPSLPLACGDFSVAQGGWIVALTGCGALLMALPQGPILFGTVGLSMLIGSIYSLQPIRLKRFPFWAAFCIVGVRGVVVNLGFFSHFSGFWKPLDFPAEVWALSGFVVLFSVAIALFKDIPDLEGDRQYRVRTLTVRLGRHAVFRICRWVLVTCYLLLLCLGSSGILTSVQLILFLISHLGLLALMWRGSKTVNLNNNVSLSNYYQFIWKLFFCEYILFPLACLLN